SVVRMSLAVCEMSGVWWLSSITPLVSIKLSRCGICSRSDGTLGLSRVKCTLSNWISMTCWMAPWSELSWQPLADGWGAAAAGAAISGAESTDTASASAAGSHSASREAWGKREKFIGYLLGFGREDLFL